MTQPRTKGYAFVDGQRDRRRVLDHGTRRGGGDGSGPEAQVEPSRQRAGRAVIVVALTRMNVALRALVEAGVVVGLAYWGFTTGDSALARIVLGVGAPVVGFGLWGVVDFRQAGRHAEALRLLQELAISGLAALALIGAGRPALGWALATLSVVHHAIVYLLGGKLLKRST